MNDRPLIRRDDSTLSVSFTEAAMELKQNALASSALVGKVVDPATQEQAVAAQQEITTVLSLAEKARKACKEPVLNFGRSIDARAAEFVKELKEEQVRIATLVGDFQALEAAKVRAAEQARLAEERRIEEERRRAELAAIQAAEQERQKLAEREREIARQAAAAKSKREAELLAQQQAEIERQRALAEAKSHAELDRINEQHANAMAANSAMPVYEAARATGQRVVEDWDVIVTDVWLLARSHPSCVKIEALVGEIKGLLKAGVKVAGVRAEKVVKSGVTRSRTMAAIDV